MKTPCCNPLRVSLGRYKNTDRLGLFLEEEFLTGNKNLVLRFRKGKKAEEPGIYNATFIMVRYCPFCGAKVTTP